MKYLLLLLLINHFYISKYLNLLYFYNFTNKYDFQY